MNAQHNIMKLALGDQWQALPPPLKRHYQDGNNQDIGHLDVEYPGFMQPYLNLLKLFGALVNKRGVDIKTTVKKYTDHDTQYWRRTLHYPDSRLRTFNSRWIYAGENKLIEFTNPMLGLKMEVWVEGEDLYYSGLCYIIKLGKLHIPIPEWLVLGHTTIVERAVDDAHFEMDFRLTHPLFGQVFRYSGRFRTEREAGD